MLSLSNILPLLQSELNWMVTGERLKNGWLLYRDLWDDTAPLSAGFYALINTVFGRSVLSFRILGAIVAFIQIVQFQYLTRKTVYSENNLLPSFLYVLGINLFPDFFTVSPPLLALCFLLPALGKSLAHIEQPVADDSLFSIGFFAGVATLFYLPAAIFLLCILFGLTLVASMNLRRIFLIVFGFFFVLGIVFIFFFFNDAGNDLLYCYLSDFTFSDFRFSGFRILLLISLPFLVIFIFGFLQSVTGNVRLINYQLRIVQFMFFWGITALFSTQIGNNREAFQLIMFVPVMAYFGTHLFSSFRRPVVREISGIGFVCIMVAITLSSSDIVLKGSQFWQTKDLLADTKSIHPAVYGKKILILGSHRQDYFNNRLATPYFSPFLYDKHLADMDNYTSVTAVYENFSKDMPDVIIDDGLTITKVFNRIPALANEYQQQEKGIYVKKPKK
jgi:hypothetical protein